MTPALKVTAVAALLAFCAVPGSLGDTRVSWNGNWAFACNFNSELFQEVRVAPEMCGPTCNTVPSCTHFTWVPDDSPGSTLGSCKLMQGRQSKDDAIYDGTTRGIVCGVRNIPSPGVNDSAESRVSRAPTPQIQWIVNWAMSCSFSSESFQSQQPVQAKDCGPNCNAVPRCTHFTWTQENGGTCKLMAGSAAKADAISVPDPDAVCGVKGSVLNWTDENWARGCYFQEGKELRSSRSSADSADQCRRQCLDDLECTHFSWKDTTCRLMSGSAAKEDASASTDSRMVCGVMTCLATSLKSLGVAWSLVAAALGFCAWFY